MKPIKRGVYELRTMKNVLIKEEFSAVNAESADVLIREIAKASTVQLAKTARYKLSRGDLDKAKWIHLEL